MFHILGINLSLSSWSLYAPFCRVSATLYGHPNWVLVFPRLCIFLPRQPFSIRGILFGALELWHGSCTPELLSHWQPRERGLGLWMPLRGIPLEPSLRPICLLSLFPLDRSGIDSFPLAQFGYRVRDYPQPLGVAFSGHLGLDFVGDDISPFPRELHGHVGCWYHRHQLVQSPPTNDYIIGGVGIHEYVSHDYGTMCIPCSELDEEIYVSPLVNPFPS